MGSRTARIIRLLPRPLPNRFYKPESQFVDAFLSGSYLEIAKGNEEREFSRAECLDLNEEIVRIATASPDCDGIAIHWREDGMYVIGRSGRK